MVSCPGISGTPYGDDGGQHVPGQIYCAKRISENPNCLLDQRKRETTTLSLWGRERESQTERERDSKPILFFHFFFIAIGSGVQINGTSVVSRDEHLFVLHSKRRFSQSFGRGGGFPLINRISPSEGIFSSPLLPSQSSLCFRNVMFSG